MKAVINGEGAYFDEDPPNLTLQALADAQYYLPEDLLQVGLYSIAPNS